MSKHIEKVALNENGTVTLFFSERRRRQWGNPIVARMRHTISRRELEAALREAKITVPWNEVPK